MWAPPGVSVRCVGWIGLRSTARILENGRECSSEYIVYNSPYGVVDWVAQDPLCWEPLDHPIIQQCFPQSFLNAQSILIAPPRDHPPRKNTNQHLTCSGPPESPWQESWPPVSCPAQRKISGMNSCRPARRNIDLHRSLLTIGTETWKQKQKSE